MLSKNTIAEHLWGDDSDQVDSHDFIYVHLRNLRLGDGSVDVLLHRQDKNITVTVTRRESNIVVVARY